MLFQQTLGQNIGLVMLHVTLVILTWRSFLKAKLSECDLVIDIRVNDCYSNTEILEVVKANVNAEVTPRSMHLNASSIPIAHDLVQAGIALGRTTYGSPTLSDQSVLSCQSLKLGPGETLRSHSADEFIFINEIEEGIDLYIKILTDFFKL